MFESVSLHVIRRDFNFFFFSGVNAMVKVEEKKNNKKGIKILN